MISFVGVKDGSYYLTDDSYCKVDSLDGLISTVSDSINYPNVLLKNYQDSYDFLKTDHIEGY